MKQYMRVCAVVACLRRRGTSAAFAQQAFYGSIVGHVTDVTNAVVAGAPLTITNVETGVSLELKTNAQGLYQALNLKA